MSEAFHTDERELKRRFNETELPRIQLEARVLADLDGRLRKKQPLRSKRLLAAGCSAAAVILMLGILSSFPASAEKLRQIPVVGKLFEGNIFMFAGDNGLIDGQNAGMSAALNKEASDQGVTIKLQDVLYDGARLSIGFEIISEQPDRPLFLGDIAVTVDGQFKPGASISTKPHAIDDKRSVGIMTIDFDGDEHADSFDLELSIGEVAGLTGDSSSPYSRIIGEWSFQMEVANHSADSINRVELAEGYEAKSKDGHFQIKGYTLTPATTKVDFTYMGETEWLSFQIKDDRGMIIQTLDSQFTLHKKNAANGSVRFAPLPSGTKEIFVTPYYLLPAKKGDVKVSAELTEAFPIALSQGNVGEVIVNDVEFLDDKTLIHYEVQGINPYLQYASLWLETVDGEMIISDFGKRTRVSDDSYQFVLEYPPLDPAQPYVLGTMTQTDMRLLEELTVKVEVSP